MFKVIEKLNPLAIHAHCYSQESAEKWIERYGNSQMFTDKTLTKDSFAIKKDVKNG